MPRREDLKKIMLIGSGPIIIGQACEFDYSGTQACKALKEEGYEIILVNSNPATIMTDPEMSDRTYVEPITSEVCELIIEKERPDALLPTIGGQTGLNVSVELAEKGILEKYGVEMIGANLEAIKKAELNPMRPLRCHTRQPGYLFPNEDILYMRINKDIKIRGFPSPDYSEFSFGFYSSNILYLYMYVTT